MPIKGFEFINLRLEVVKNFLDKNLKAVDVERTIICEQKENGKFHDHLDDFSNAIFPSTMQEKIVIRAVFHELSAIIEFMFQDFAINNHYKSNFGELKRNIEEAHNFKFNDLKNCDYKKIEQIRQIAIDFKHHRGYKYPDKYNKYTWLEIELSPESRPSRKETYQAINEVKNLFKTLQKKIKPESKIEILESELENLE